MENRFSRTEMLIGEKGLDVLSKSRVAVFGVGGVGGYVVEALARSGVGYIDIIDNDRVCISNLNRQIIATETTLGMFKTEAAKNRIKDINPDCVVTCYNMFFMPETSKDIDFKKFDYVVDAIDTVSGKIELVMKCNEFNVPIISSMGAGNKMHPEMFEVADIYKTSVCPLAKVMRHELKKRGIKRLKVVYSKEQPIKTFNNSADTKKKCPGSNAFVPSVAGLVAASVVIRDLLKKVY